MGCILEIFYAVLEPMHNLLRVAEHLGIHKIYCRICGLAIFGESLPSYSQMELESFPQVVNSEEKYTRFCFILYLRSGIVNSLTALLMSILT